MAFSIKKRGKLTYYYQGDRPVLSSLVTEELPDGDLKIYFAGLTGGYSAKNVLGLDELVTMDPHREVPLVFRCWEDWLQEAYAEAYAGFFAEQLPEHGLPCRFTVHLLDVPDKAASYEFYSTALL